MRPERGEPAIAPAHARGDLIGGQDFLPLRQDTIEVLAVVNRWICRAQRAQTRTIAPAVVRDTARRVELDGLERPHERPAQAQSVLQRLVEILRRDVAVFNQTKRPPTAAPPAAG